MTDTLELLAREDPETLSKLRGLRKETKTGVVYLVVLSEDELRQILLQQLTPTTE